MHKDHISIYTRERKRVKDMETHSRPTPIQLFLLRHLCPQILGINAPFKPKTTEQQSIHKHQTLHHGSLASFLQCPSAKRHQRHRWLKVILTHAKDLVKSTKEGHHSSRVAKLNERNSAKKNKVCCIRLLGKKQTWNM